jgi:hypothetical protein
VADVQSKSHDELGSLLSGDLLLFNQLHDGGDGWIGSSHAHGVKDKVFPGLLFQFLLFVGGRLLLRDFVENFKDVLLGQESESLGSDGEFGKSFLFGNGSLIILEILGGFQNQFLNTFLHLAHGQRRNEHGSEWCLLQWREGEVVLRVVVRLMSLGSLLG